ncbi:receptor-like kinase, partial [Trifolium medium]|nr:receptor-like kinase [Trifolium medium]
LVDREGLWFRVLAARYGVERGRLREGGPRGSSWWRELIRIQDVGGVVGGEWFGEHILKKVGDGSNTFFWTDPWVDGIPLCEQFERLFDLAENKSASVAEMFSLGWGTGGEAWVWRRQLRAWEEEMLWECQTLLLNISLQDHIQDRWQWRPDPDIGYTICGAYQLLTTLDSITLDAEAGLIWHSQVPLKVSIFARQLLRDKLPTRANLVSRGILSPAAHYCVSGCGEVESAQHLFLSCSNFGGLWSLVSSWIGSSSVTAQTLSDHFVQFTISAGGLRARCSFMQLIWLADDSQL